MLGGTLRLKALLLFACCAILFSCSTASERAETLAEEIDATYWGDWPKVIEKTTEGLKKYDTSAWLHAQRATAYRETDDYKDALADYDIALTLQPDLEPAYTDRAILLMRLNRVDDAEVDLRTALNLDGDDVTAMVTLAEVMAIQKNDFETCRYLKDASAKGYDVLGLIESNSNFEFIIDTSCHSDLIKEQQLKTKPQG